MLKATPKFAINGLTVHPFMYQEGTVVEKIPAGLYEIKESMFGYFLYKKSDQIALPEKVYGSTKERAERILKSFDSQNNAMSIGLFGAKGAGKTLLANYIADLTVKRGQAVIDVSSSFCTKPEYLDFIDSLGQITVIFDEFLKHLSKQDGETSSSKNDDARQNARNRQDEMLTFFQGTNNAKRLIVLIDNSAMFLSEFLTDRPGRMRYYFSYNSVEESVVKALCKDAGLDDKKTEKLAVYSKRYKVTFDIISAIINEWTMYPDDTLEHITKIMNVPELRQRQVLKGFVVESTLPDGFTLSNELVNISSEGHFELQTERANPFFNEPELTEEEFDKSKWENEWAYSTYKACRLSPVLKHTFGFDDSNLVGLHRNKHAYKIGTKLAVTIEIAEDSEIIGDTLNTFF